LSELGLLVLPNELPKGGVEPGVVYEQDPVSGEKLKIGDSVTLTFTPKIGTIMVPPIQGLLYDVAASQLADLGLAIAIVEEREDPTTTVGQIIVQDPAATVLVAPGSTVSVGRTNIRSRTTSINRVTVSL
jgi:beta-lactam-binding protein with PASTA domain